MANKNCRLAVIFYVGSSYMKHMYHVCRPYYTHSCCVVEPA